MSEFDPVVAQAMRVEVTSAGVRLAVTEFGGTGPAVLLLHGLAGYAGEWATVASGLVDQCRVVGFDARGHGASDRAPRDVGREALIADVAVVVEHFDLAPVVVVGQSLGGVVAAAFAARHPNLVRGLVLIEAAPSDGDAEIAVRQTIDALRDWPSSFESRGAAAALFEERFGTRRVAEAWAAGLEAGRGRLVPRFDVSVLEQIMRSVLAHPGWDEWSALRCPILIVRAGHGVIPRSVAEKMLRRQSGARLLQIEQSVHDVHLDRPYDVVRAIRAYVDEISD